MKRSDFLKTLGAMGVGSMIPVKKVIGAPGNVEAAKMPQGVDCVLIPQETEGPYPLDLSQDATKFRQDITEGRSGLPLNVILTVVNINDGCAPIQNARIDIWHCDKDGVYSGYSQPGANTVGQTFMRGIQMTDSNGQVEFKTIYPGWYAGRITHIHFQVFLSSVLRATSQMAFPEDVTKSVYTTDLYKDKGQNTSVSGNATDNVFGGSADDLAHEMATITPNETTGGYNATLTIGMNGPLSGLSEMEPETGGEFLLRQNSPNPFRGRTAIEFSLARTSHVELVVVDLSGKRVATVLGERMSAGEHTANWDGTSKGDRVSPGNYLFQLTVTNDLGRFAQCKVLTLY